MAIFGKWFKRMGKLGSLLLDIAPFSFLGASLAGCDWNDAGTFKHGNRQLGE